MLASADTLQAVGSKRLGSDPCGHIPNQGDVLSVMKQHVENLQQAFP